MYAYFLRRLVALLPVLLGISILAFGLGSLAPGDPTYAIYQQIYGQPPPNQTAVDQIRDQLGLNAPLPLRYTRWVISALSGDLGKSYRTGLPVLKELATNMRTSLQFAAGGLLLACLLAFPVGILAAVYPNSLVDLATRIFSLLGAAMPSYFLAYVLIIAFSVKLHWLPVAGVGNWRYLVLPWTTLGLGGAATLSRLIRSSMLEVIDSDYIRAARAKGVPERKVILWHALRNALIPVITVMGGMFGSTLAGAVIVETIFAWPGIGRLIIDGISFRDYPIIQGFVLFSGTIFVLVNLAVDMLYTIIDPRVRFTRKET